MANRTARLRYRRKAIRRSGLDYWQHLDLEVLPDWPTFLDRIPHFNPWLFTKTGERSHRRNLPGRYTLVFGSESLAYPIS